MHTLKYTVYSTVKAHRKSFCRYLKYSVESGQYVLLSGYDQYNVTLYAPQTQETQKMGLNDATEYFKNLQNDFLCALAVE